MKSLPIDNSKAFEIISSLYQKAQKDGRIQSPAPKSVSKIISFSCNLGVYTQDVNLSALCFCADNHLRLIRIKEVTIFATSKNPLQYEYDYVVGIALSSKDFLTPRIGAKAVSVKRINRGPKYNAYGVCVYEWRARKKDNKPYLRKISNLAVRWGNKPSAVLMATRDKIAQQLDAEVF